MMDFIRAAAPFVIIGISAAVICVNMGKHKKGEAATETYTSEGMCIGMTLGISLASALKFNLGLGISLGMLIGQAVGSSMNKGEKKDHE